VGLLVGAATAIGQGFLPGQWNTLVNSGAIWLIPVFLMGSRETRPGMSAVVGVLTLLATVAGYYGTAALRGAPISMFPVAVWVGVGVIAGPLYGLAGRWARGDNPITRVAGVAMLCSVLLGEGFYLTLVLHYYWSGGAMILAGVAALFLLSRRADVVRTLIVMVLFSAIAAAAYLAINWVMSLRGGA